MLRSNWLAAKQQPTRPRFLNKRLAVRFPQTAGEIRGAHERDGLALEKNAGKKHVAEAKTMEGLAASNEQRIE
jgi:hypothetical protein